MGDFGADQFHRGAPRRAAAPPCASSPPGPGPLPPLPRRLPPRALLSPLGNAHRAAGLGFARRATLAAAPGPLAASPARPSPRLSHPDRDVPRGTRPRRAGRRGNFRGNLRVRRERGGVPRGVPADRHASLRFAAVQNGVPGSPAVHAGGDGEPRDWLLRDAAQFDWSKRQTGTEAKTGFVRAIAGELRADGRREWLGERRGVRRGELLGRAVL